MMGGMMMEEGAPSSAHSTELKLVRVEAVLRPTSMTDTRLIEEELSSFLRNLEIPLHRKVALNFMACTSPLPPAILRENVEEILIYYDGEEGGEGSVIPRGAACAKVTCYALNDEEPVEEMGDEEDEEVAMTREWTLPARSLHTLWDSLVYDTEVKRRLLSYASSALLFSDMNIDSSLIQWNRIVLLHGPPGTGKTSLCKALAQRLAIQFNHRYDIAQLVEVNAHSLFSKWFSESGKLVAKLFTRIQEMAEDEGALTFVLLDEVESLTAARTAAAAGSEPSDSIRVVNALLTQLDALRSRPNVMILTTSNITNAIDSAFLDRADIQAYIGPPTLHARYDILRSCIIELVQKGLIKLDEAYDENLGSHAVFYSFELQESLKQQHLQPLNGVKMLSLKRSVALSDTCEQLRGVSGRRLRKLPFLAHALCMMDRSAGEGEDAWSKSSQVDIYEFILKIRKAHLQDNIQEETDGSQGS